MPDDPITITETSHADALVQFAAALKDIALQDDSRSIPVPAVTLMQAANFMLDYRRTLEANFPVLSASTLPARRAEVLAAYQAVCQSAALVMQTIEACVV